jgi:sigma-B regulation protein RsbU (phosphoserine phosphatase)
MTLRARLVLSFAVLALLAVLCGAATVFVTVRRDQATARARSSIDNEETIGRLRAAYLDQETGYRGYIATGDTVFLEPYDSGRADVVAVERALRTGTALGTEVQAALTRVQRAANAWHELAAPDLALMRAGRFGAARASLGRGESKAAFDELRASLKNLSDAAHREVVSARARSDTTRSNLAAVGVATFVLVFLALFLAAFLVGRWVTRPIAALRRQVASVRGGELDERVALAGPPELASLAADVDAMRRRLVTVVTESHRAREAMEQDAAVVLTLGAQVEPEAPPLPPGWSLAGELRPAEGLIAGDTYDFVPLRNQTIGLVVVDISGHGAVPGIVALRGKELLRAALSLDAPPGEAIRTAAEQLADLGDEEFLSAFVAVVDPATGAVAYANAGHPPALHSRADRIECLEPTGPIIGPLAATWRTATLTIQPGESLAIFTDGLIEARDADHVPFGEDHLRALVRARPGDTATAVVTRCLDAVEEVSPGRRLADDATLVVLVRAPRATRPTIPQSARAPT